MLVTSPLVYVSEIINVEGLLWVRKSADVSRIKDRFGISDGLPESGSPWGNQRFKVRPPFKDFESRIRRGTPCAFLPHSQCIKVIKMGYSLAVLGCGTMGVAILSGVLKSLEARLSLPLNENGEVNEPPSGISTPTASQFLNAPEGVLPSKFTATVGREETVRKLKRVFKDMGRLGEAVDVRGGPGVNASTAAQADVILVWYVWTALPCPSLTRFVAQNQTWRERSFRKTAWPRRSTASSSFPSVRA